MYDEFERKKTKGAEYFSAKKKVAEIKKKIDDLIKNEMENSENYEYCKIHSDVKLNIVFTRSDESKDALKDLLKLIIEEDGYKLKQIECRKKISAEYGYSKVEKNWTAPLPLWAIEYAESIMEKSKNPRIKPLAESEFNTLNDIKAILTKNLTSDYSEKFKPEIIIYADKVFVNNSVFKLSDNKLKNGKSYKLLRVNIDKFKQALADRIKKPRAVAKKKLPKSTNNGSKNSQKNHLGTYGIE